MENLYGLVHPRNRFQDLSNMGRFKLRLAHPKLFYAVVVIAIVLAGLAIARADPQVWLLFDGGGSSGNQLMPKSI